MKYIPHLTFILVFLFASASVQAQSMQNVFDLVPVNEATHTAATSGDWEEAATWGGSLPGENAKIVIPNGITVTINSQLASEFEWILISNGGKLAFNPSQTTLLKVETIVSGMSGEFEMGTASAPIASNQTATIIFSGQQQAIDFGANDPGYLKRGAILMGKTTIHGEEKSSWHALTTVPQPGATSVTLAATPTNWKVGDRIVIAGTNPDNPETDEVRVISAINGTTVSFSESLVNPRPLPSGVTDLQVHVANLSRNILFTSEHTAVPGKGIRGYRGHVMIMHSNDADIRYARFYQLGRTNKQIQVDDWFIGEDDGLVKGDGFNVRGRYSIHFHRGGVDPTTTPGVILGCAVEDDPGWGIVNHSSNVDVIGNATYNIVGGAYQTEAGDEVGSFVNNIAIRTVNPDYPMQNPNLTAPDAKEGSQDFAFQGDAFWVHGGGVNLEGNVASGSSGHAYIYWPEGLYEGNVATNTITQNVFLPENIPNGNLLTTPKLNTQWVPVKKFANNIGYSSTKGFTTFYLHTNFFHDEETIPVSFLNTVNTTIEDLTLWNNRERGVDFNFTDRITFKNLKVYGDKDPKRIGIDANHFRLNFRGAYLFENIVVSGFEVGVDVPTQGETWFKGGSFDNKIDFRIENPQSRPRYLKFDDLSFPNTVYSQGENTKFQLVEDLGDLEGHVQDGVNKAEAGAATKHPIFFAMPDVILLNFGQYNNERLYYDRQLANDIPIPNALSFNLFDDETVSVPAKYVGKTNQQLLDQYSLAFGGAIMPADARTIPEVSGGKVSTSSPVTASSGMFAPACTYSPIWVEFFDCWHDFDTEQFAMLNVVAASGGTVTADPVRENYKYGEMVKVTAISDEGKVFKGWGGPTNSTNPTVYIEVTTDYNANGTLTATFENATIVSTEEVEQVRGFRLQQNYPNPFNPSTRIEFEVPGAGRVKLEVFNMLGQKVAGLLDERKAAGSYTVQFNAGALPSGVYLYRLQAGGAVITKKLTLVK